jgi:hypothetical protein
LLFQEIAVPYSTYNYILPSELAAYIHTMASVTNEALAATFISDAERVIDAFAGPGPQFYQRLGGDTAALVASGATTLTSDIFGSRRPDYWAAGGAYIHIVSAADASLNGERRLVVGSANPNTVTLASGFGAALAAGAQFQFQQESAFPRIWDQDTWGNPDMPELLKAAVAAQVEYGIIYGSEAFGLGDTNIVADTNGDVTSRSYGSGYSESRDARRRDGMAVWIAPRARVLMRRLLASTGKLRS